MKYMTFVQGAKRHLTAAGLTAVSAFALLAGSTGTALATPAAHGVSDASSLCNLVSASQVSSVVGYSVPAAVTLVNKGVFDKALRITATVTICTYGASTSLADLKKTVVLVYDKLSKTVTLAQAEAEVKAADAKDGSNIKLTPYNGLGHTGIYVSFSEDGIVSEAIECVNGTKIAGAGLYTAAPKSKVAALAKLAVSADFG